jgi:suppressor of G2 allele of SKP1
VVLYIRGHTVDGMVPHPDHQSLTLELTVDCEKYVKAWAFSAAVDPASLRVDRGRVKVEFILAKEAAVSWPGSSRTRARRSRSTSAGTESGCRRRRRTRRAAPTTSFRGSTKTRPDAQRAMMKSIVESQGTVLSTNWEDVGSRRVAPQPPKDE